MINDIGSNTSGVCAHTHVNVSGRMYLYEEPIKYFASVMEVEQNEIKAKPKGKKIVTYAVKELCMYAMLLSTFKCTRLTMINSTENGEKEEE